MRSIVLALTGALAVNALPVSPQGQLTGAIYRGNSVQTNGTAVVKSATAVPNLQVYVRPRAGGDWTGPVTTDLYGRFVFPALPPGIYQLRVYDGSVRVWDSIVTAPAVLPRIVVRDVTVAYYVKSQDGGHVEGVLETLGFPYLERKAVNQNATNAIWFGDDVGLDDVKSLAVALVQAKIPIRAIRQFRDGKGSKAKLIEVGSDADRNKDAVFTADRIHSAQGFPHL
jgi:hypothetical protein